MGWFDGWLVGCLIGCIDGLYVSWLLHIWLLDGLFEERLVDCLAGWRTGHGVDGRWESRLPHGVGVALDVFGNLLWRAPRGRRGERREEGMGGLGSNRLLHVLVSCSCFIPHVVFK